MPDNGHSKDYYRMLARIILERKFRAKVKKAAEKDTLNPPNPLADGEVYKVAKAANFTLTDVDIQTFINYDYDSMDSDTLNNVLSTANLNKVKAVELEDEN